MDREVRNLRRTGALALTLALFAALLLSPEAGSESCRAALRLCGELIIPSLFPFFVLSILLSRLGLPTVLGRALSPAAARLYGVSGAGATALVIGLTGGYPLGAAYIADMEKSGVIGVCEGERLLGFCNNSGPAFIVGAVGVGIFRSGRIGLLLYAVHILSALLTGLFFRAGSGDFELCKPIEPDENELTGVLPGAVRQALISVLNVCAFVVCFTVLVGVLDAGGQFSLLCGRIAELLGTGLRFNRAVLTGLLELGSGVAAMRGLRAGPAELALAAGMLGWGGLSVQMQTSAVLEGSNIKGALHFAGRLISATVAAVLGYIAGSFL